MTPRSTLFMLMFTWLVLAAPAAGQDVVVQASTDATVVGTDDVVTLTVQVRGATMADIETPSPPITSGLALNRSVPSTNRSVVSINGRVQQTVTFRWQYRPVRTGTAQIDSVTLQISGETYRTNPIEVEVVSQPNRTIRRTGPGASPDTSRGAGDGTSDDEDADVVDEEEIFIRTDVSTRQAYPNEPVVVTYRLYFDTGITLRRSRLSGGWDTPGFWREDLNVPQRPVPDVVEEDGRPYHTFVLKRSVVFPTRAGSLEVAPFRIETTAERSPGRRHRLDSFFSQENHEERIQVASDPVAIQVTSLPDGAPAGFHGAVGRYQVSSELHVSDLSVGEGAQFSIRIRGSGNLATLAPLELDLPPALHVYGPEIETSFDRDGTNLSGERIFRYTLVPSEAGTHEVPPVRFAFFDPHRERYEQQVTDAHTLHVSEAPTDSLLSVAERPPSATASQSSSSYWIYGGAGTALALAGLLAFLYQRRRNEKRTESSPTPSARPNLDRARTLPAHDRPAALADALEQTIFACLSDCLGIEARGLPRERLEQALSEAGLHVATRHELLHLFDAFDRIRFAPAATDPDELATLLERSEELLSSLRDPSHT